ncbi:MAG: hypothetical protein ACLFUY_04355 [Desulfobacterales bacterium]
MVTQQMNIIAKHTKDNGFVRSFYSAAAVFLQKANPGTPWLTGGAKKEFPRSRSLFETRFPLGNLLFRAAVRATKYNFL